MATNKRKDAAALFELLDNSTLKVPKNAGSLKIPSWWSSTSNPSPKVADDNFEDVSFEENGGVVTASAPAATQVNAEPSRLFEPPAGGEAPQAMPSIRPPAAEKAMQPEQPAPAPRSSRSAHVVSPPKPPIDPTASVGPREPKIFAPQMYAQQRRPWVTPRPGAFARMPAWVLGGGVAAAILLISGVVIVARMQGKTAQANNQVTQTGNPAGAAGTTAAGSGAGNSILPPPSVPMNATPVASNAAQRTLPPVPPASRTAAWYGPGKIDRSYDLYYVIIASTPSKDVAERNAKFIAENGVSVSVEYDRKGIYHLVSVDGFPSNAAARPLRDRIVEIGHLTEAYRKTKKAWDDAMIQNRLSSPR